MEVRMIRKILIAMFFLTSILLGTGCKAVQITSSTPISEDTAPTSDNTVVTVPIQVAENEPYDYCFAYPQDFTLQPYGSQVEVIGPFSGQGSLSPGMVWIDVTEAQDHSAQDIANDEVKAFGGTPPRSMVMLGNEEALVLDGMPGQDPIRKVYIVHNGFLYTLNFTHDSEDETAKDQMETLFASVISSWVWLSSGAPCPSSK